MSPVNPGKTSFLTEIALGKFALKEPFPACHRR